MYDKSSCNEDCYWDLNDAGVAYGCDYDWWKRNWDSGGMWSVDAAEATSNVPQLTFADVVHQDSILFEF